MHKDQIVSSSRLCPSAITCCYYNLDGVATIPKPFDFCQRKQRFFATVCGTESYRKLFFIASNYGSLPPYSFRARRF